MARTYTTREECVAANPPVKCCGLWLRAYAQPAYDGCNYCMLGGYAFSGGPLLVRIEVAFDTRVRRVSLEYYNSKHTFDHEYSAISVEAAINEVEMCMLALVADYAGVSRALSSWAEVE